MPRLSRARSAQAKAQAGEVLAGHLEDCWDEPDARAKTACTYLDLLQGAWVTVSGRRRAEFLVCGTQVTVHFADGEIYMGSLTIDPYARPAAMDIRIDEGPQKHRGKIALCVYEVDGDTLRWCTAGPGQLARPDGVFAEKDRYHLSLVFRREHRMNTV
jgi:uncharacterized protein (TIGR03067 family)